MLPLLWEKGSNGRKLTFRRTKGKEWKWQGHDRNGKGKTVMVPMGNEMQGRKGQERQNRKGEGKERKGNKKIM